MIGGALGVSKSSVQAAYGTKEEVQLAAVAAATQIFIASVVARHRSTRKGYRACRH
jgi:hypothetical protein